MDASMPSTGSPSTGLTVFQNDEFQLHVQPHGDSFAVQAASLAAALWFREGSDLVRTLPDDEKTMVTADTGGGPQQVWFVTEPGFYRAIGQRQAARIRDEGARRAVERFQSWVFREVLPSIRQTGGYGAPAPQPVTRRERMAHLAELKREMEILALASERRMVGRETLEPLALAILGRMGELPEVVPTPPKPKKVDTTLDDILAVVRDNPGITANRICLSVRHSRSRVLAVLQGAIKDGRILAEDGPRRARNHRISA